ncbi:MAG: hypothetical protein H7Y07_12550 [Pyrinomonadaceae bacterium]|nr:hypothetical protein [Sphingobacteriaceae bacterium]
MRVEKLSDIKKELRLLNTEVLTEICLRLAKYKKDNKELLSYLLYDADNPLNYAEEVKSTLLLNFKNLNKSAYTSTKELRKIIRLLTKHTKYTGSKEVEIEFLLWFCTNFLQYADTRSSHKPLQAILNRQLEKIKRILPKLHEDLQYDYSATFTNLIEEANNKLRYFNKDDFKIENL